jgi:hypothetical protein
VSERLVEFMGALTGWLNAAEIPYMVAGSFASTYHGHPRATQDVDIVIDPSRLALENMIASVPSERAYIDRQTALSALSRRDMFNLIDLVTGWKADFIVRKARPFSVTEFERRVARRWMDIDVFVATPEDVILSKLEWSRLSGGSERQLRDVVGVLNSRGDGLDVGYIESWVDALGVRQSWQEALSRREPTTG